MAFDNDRIANDLYKIADAMKSAEARVAKLLRNCTPEMRSRIEAAIPVHESPVPAAALKLASEITNRGKDA